MYELVRLNFILVKNFIVDCSLQHVGIHISFRSTVTAVELLLH